MKVLITGASGFVGQALIQALPKAAEVHVISRNYSDTLAAVNKMFISYNALETNTTSYDAVIHLAGLAHDTRNQKAEQEYYTVNAGLTQKVVEWVNKTQPSCKLIYLSSIKTYSDADYITEETHQNPKSVYGRSKLAAEQVIESRLSKQHQYCILQPVMIYGKDNKGNLPRLFQLFSKLPFPFKHYPNSRSILSINNLNLVIHQILTEEVTSGKYIASDDRPISTYEILQALFSNSPVALKAFKTPTVLVRMGLQVARLLNLQTLQKVLGDLVVSNAQLKRALNIEKMPFETKNELQKLELWK